MQTYDNTPLAHVSKWCPQYGLSPDSIENLVSPAVPKEELVLNWVYGFSSRLTRSSVKYDSNNLIVYPAATFVVIYDKVANKQNYFTGHDDTVTALDYNPTSNIFASGQRKANGEAVIVCVWSYSESLVTLQRINCGPINAVSSLVFNNDGSLLAVSCMDEMHSIQVYDWRSGVLKGQISTGAKKPLCLAFSIDSTLNSFRLLEGGVLHFNLLEGRNSDFVSSKFGVFGSKKANILCCAALPLAIEGGNEFVVGLSNGNIGVISRGDRRFSNSPASGMTSVTAIHIVRVKEATIEEPSPVFKVIIAGSKGLIKVLDQEFAPTAEFDIYKSIPDLSVLGKERGIKSIYVDKLSRKILFGTSGGEISELDITTGASMMFESSQPLITSHCKDQTFAVDVHPIRQECITGGDDKTLRIWDLESKSLITMIQLQDIVRTVAFSPNGQIVVAGLGGATRRGNEWQDRINETDSTKVRSLVVLSYLQNKLQVVYEATEPTDAITCVAFAPDQRSLFVGSRGIKLYDVFYNFFTSF
jgi:WD40 repeat protein